MIQGNKKINLTEELILSKISEYDIFKMYMPGNWKLNVVTHSPFHRDDIKSLIIGTKFGTVTFKDFADTTKKGNCFKFVQLLHHLSNYYDALKMINRDFGLFGEFENTEKYKTVISQYEQPIISEKKYAIIQVITRKFTNEELAYWNTFYQDISDLKRERIYSIKSLYLNKQKFSLRETELRFGYFYDGHWKIYRPFADPKVKWMPNNVPLNTLEGKENLVKENSAIITKSKKDKMVLLKVYPHVCATQNESSGCFSEENVEFLRQNSSRQILSFDSDAAGVKNSRIITKEFDFDYLNVPRNYLSDGIKDFADLGKEYGLIKVEQILKKKKL
tara:strand:+ start:29947 stop:30942 length:996 start_codon:yes stop_codon:yes gene_type:complete